MGNYDEALDDINKAIELEPLYPKSFVERADIHNFMGNHKKALSDIKTAFQWDLKPHYIRGKIYDAMNRRNEARKDYLAALKLNPEARVSSKIRERLKVLQSANQ
ncbi:MAG: tetratricopeptide repeat protein [Rhodospirillaceae bacterium]|jgi:tetratricopeptide (TPR) repeat protein|nr:tetratricopeptide repeat protein [Rhodospirillaceae bacterium]